MSKLNPEENLARLTPEHRRRFDQSDFAKNLDRINPDSDISLKHFKPRDFHEVCGMREEFRNVGEPLQDEESGHGFKRGDRVEYLVFNIGTFSDDRVKGVVRGIRGPFVRVGLELHLPGRLRKI